MTMCDDDFLIGSVIHVMRDRVQKGLCPSCRKVVSLADFQDSLSLLEYHISGFCQKCQNEIFKEESEGK